MRAGKRTVLDRITEFIAIRRDRSVFPMRLAVSHLSGVGEDSVFMGVIEPVTTERGCAKAWVLSSGQIASVDKTFSDWFGFRAAEVMGTSIGAVLHDARVLEE